MGFNQGAFRKMIAAKFGKRYQLTCNVGALVTTGGNIIAPASGSMIVTNMDTGQSINITSDPLVELFQPPEQFNGASIVFNRTADDIDIAKYLVKKFETKLASSYRWTMSLSWTMAPGDHLNDHGFGAQLINLTDQEFIGEFNESQQNEDQSLTGTFFINTRPPARPPGPLWTLTH